MANALLNLTDSAKYGGQYVAMTDFEGGKVVANDSDPGRALQTARENGCQDPVLIYVPEKDAIQIF